MALDPILWALKDAPVKDAGERLILTVLGEHADEDGTRAFPSQKTIAGVAMLTDRSVREKLRALEERGLIVRGDQRFAEVFPADKRPVVYDLAIPYTWWGERWERMNRSRTARGLRPLAPEERPPIAPPPGRDATASKREGNGPGAAAAGTEFRPEGGSARNEVPQRPELSSGGDRNQVPPTHPYNPPQDPPLKHSSPTSGRDERPTGRSTLHVVTPPTPTPEPEPTPASPAARFDEFWSVWPKRTGKDAARRRWNLAVKSHAVADAIIAAATEIGEHRLCPQPSDPRMRFVPDPATWLNRAGWTDEYTLWRRWEDDEADVAARASGAAPFRPANRIRGSQADTDAFGDLFQQGGGL